VGIQSANIGFNPRPCSPMSVPIMIVLCTNFKLQLWKGVRVLSCSSTLFFQALEALNKKDITEIKSYGKPPALVEKVLESVMILRGNEPTWAEAKKQLG